MYDTELEREFNRDGYAVCRSFLCEEELKVLQRAIEQYRREVLPQAMRGTYEKPGEEETLKSMNKMDYYDPFFDEYLLKNPRIEQLSERLLHGPTIIRNVQWFNKPPRIGGETPPHQDNIFAKLVPPEALTLWIALDPMDASNSCIRYLPGSHRSVLRNHVDSDVSGFSKRIDDFGERDRSEEVAIAAEPGDLLIHHIMTVHRTDPNESERHRRAIGFQVKSTRAVETNPRAYRPETRTFGEAVTLND